MQFSFMVSEVTGVFMECDINEGSFDSCLYSQDSEDDLNFDQKVRKLRIIISKKH
jgi:hypothetical protein